MAVGGSGCQERQEVTWEGGRPELFLPSISACGALEAEPGAQGLCDAQGWGGREVATVLVPDQPGQGPMLVAQ